jgi:hypothetical protein
MRDGIRLALKHALGDEIEGENLPGDVGFRVEASLGERDREGDMTSKVPIVLPFRSVSVLMSESGWTRMLWQPPCEPANRRTSNPCSIGFSQS